MSTDMKDSDLHTAYRLVAQQRANELTQEQIELLIEDVDTRTNHTTGYTETPYSNLGMFSGLIEANVLTKEQMRRFKWNLANKDLYVFYCTLPYFTEKEILDLLIQKLNYQRLNYQKRIDFNLLDIHKLISTLIQDGYFNTEELRILNVIYPIDVYIKEMIPNNF